MGWCVSNDLGSNIALRFKGKLSLTHNAVSLHNPACPESGSADANLLPELLVGDLCDSMTLASGNDGNMVVIILEQILGIVDPGSLEPLGHISRVQALIHHLLVRGGRHHASVLPDLTPEGTDVLHRPLPQIFIILCIEQHK